MAEFKYKAKDSRGKIKTGTLTAVSKPEAKKMLAKMRLRPITLTASKLDASAEEGEGFKLFKRDAKGNLTISFGDPAPTTKDLIIFTKQFATMIGAGVPLIQALGVLGAQQRIPAFGAKLDRIRLAVENGAKLSDALEAYPKIFDRLYVSMVRAGEASGNLDGILLKLTIYVEKAAKIQSQVKAAMVYPSMVFVVAGVVITGLLLFVVPTFAQSFAGSGKPLPALTQAVMDMSGALAHYWYIIFGSLGAAVFAARKYINTEPGRLQFDRVLLSAPIFGPLFRKVVVGRFCNTMSTMLVSGVNLLEALTICAASSGNKVIEMFVIGVRTKVEQGLPLSEPLAEGGYFPPMVTSMVTIGEATGALDEMLVKVSEFYEDEVEVAVKTMLSMIEPIMIVVLGVIVGTLVIAMYLPIFDLGGTVG